MKHLSKLIFYSSLLFTVALSCKKDENKVFLEGGTAPALTASTGTIALAFINADKEAVKFSWTNPNYKFTTGTSSQDVSYLVEIDKKGNNFTSNSRQTVAVSKELTLSLTVGQFNDYLLNQLVLTPGIPYDIEVRVKSSMNNAATLLSNTLSYNVTPYAIPPKVTPPGTAPDYADGKLFITGSATPASWQCACGEPELLSQKFNRLSATLYEITLPLTGGGSYLLLPKYADWGAKYGFTGANNGNNVNGDDFKANGGDILAPAASGTYKIQVDFQRGKFTVTKL
ncbi:MAG: SusE domain-containing protein [Chitinophagaceae bacterium]